MLRDRPSRALETDMDYGKTGSAKPSKGAPRFDPHRVDAKNKGTGDAPSKKEALLARMKAAADKLKSN